jgi:hypothetical protein
MPSPGLVAPGRGGLDRRSDMPHKDFTGRSGGLFSGKEEIHCIFLAVWLKEKFLKTQ